MGAIVLPHQTLPGSGLFCARPWPRSLCVFSYFPWPQNPRSQDQHCDFHSASKEAEIQRTGALPKITQPTRGRLKFGPRFAGLQRLSS